MARVTTESYMPEGLPAAAPSRDGVDAGYWEGAAAHELRVQRCNDCGNWQHAPEWICHGCHSFDLGFETVEPEGVIYSWERSWHPVHPALGERVPYLVVLVELPQAGGVRMVGNLVGDPEQDVPIGATVQAVFEDHPDSDPTYTLVQWELA